jgi:hypothetical protein
MKRDEDSNLLGVVSQKAATLQRGVENLATVQCVMICSTSGLVPYIFNEYKSILNKKDIAKLSLGTP